jgi:hypothetical protein
MELRDFTETDWFGWAGATSPDSETPPRIGTVRPTEWPISDVLRSEEEGVLREEFEVTVIADRTGLGISSSENLYFYICCEFRTACWLASRIESPDGLRIDRATLLSLGVPRRDLDRGGRWNRLWK